MLASDIQREERQWLDLCRPPSNIGRSLDQDPPLSHTLPPSFPFSLFAFLLLSFSLPDPFCTTLTPLPGNSLCATLHFFVQ